MQRKRYNATRRSKRATLRAWMVSYLGGQCESCSSTENLHFDHIDPSSKSFNIATNLDLSRADLLKEVKKCQLLCYPCHKAKTSLEIKSYWSKLRQAKETIHGLLSTYTNMKCRCEECKESNRNYMKQYRMGMA